MPWAKILTAAVKVAADSNNGNFSSSVISGLVQGSGEYFTRLGIGMLPKYVYMVLDTGNDVVWIQRSPCRKCYTQADPVFDPTKSTSFSGMTCGSPLCRLLDSPGCNQRRSSRRRYLISRSLFHFVL
ncbi:Aspartyl protease protein 2 [Sarracenia purpurea var. burkii]